MLNEVTHLFPRLMEQKINSLLDTAEPTPAKAFQLYKACQSENLWHETFERFQSHLVDFFQRPKTERRKSQLDAFLDRPVSNHMFEYFHLTFRNSRVDGSSVLNIANWAHHFMRVTYKSTSSVISTDVLHKTLHYITNPPLFEKAENITFEDFCDAWKKTVFRLFGKSEDQEFTRILGELQWLNTQLKKDEAALHQRASLHATIYLTQTEIDWTIAVRDAVLAHAPVPKFPLSRGTQKQRLVDLLRTIRLYEIVQTSKLPEFIKHRDNIRATILDRCEGLLRDKAS